MHITLGSLRILANRLQWTEGFTPDIMRDRIRVKPHQVERIGSTKTYRITCPVEILSGLKDNIIEIVPNINLFNNGIVSFKQKYFMDDRKQFIVYFTNHSSMEVEELISNYLLDILLH